MKSELRAAAIEAIKNGDIVKLKALRVMADLKSQISIHYQVFGEDQLYCQDGTPIEQEPEETMPDIPGILPMITGVVVVFPDRKGFEEAIIQDREEGEFMIKS